jgi:hypothetical protein
VICSCWCVLLDNMPTVAWSICMADKLQSPTVGHLLRGLAAIQRASQAGPLTVASIAGVDNSMANVASHSIGQNRVHDSLFLNQFSHTCPLPQQQSWKHVHLTQEKILLVTSTLGGQQLPLPQQWMTGFKQTTGTTGWNTAPTPDGTPTCKIAPPQSNSTFSSVLLHRTGGATMVEAFKLALKPQKLLSVTWPKPLSWQDAPTPDICIDLPTLTYPSPM